MTYAMERARVLFGCYRRGDANDPEQYVASIAAVLTLFEPSLIREVTDPRTGISTTEKFITFMPNSGELKVYCDHIAARRDRIARYATVERREIPYLPDLSPGRRANALYRFDVPGYEAARTWAETADPADWKHDPRGIWVNWLMFTGGRTIGTMAMPAPPAPKIEAAE